ncbi:hypothetical protein PVL29_018552 [Vitis rotundifolia]|uniref:Uncharacterized protein n=1 Tax=Vitis rotundifolia TaxID=103349 RepID=A0AA38Z5A7_VITRO|nr:hypothetical protein PVL29_018552 [Vitis rotundifolia]
MLQTEEGFSFRPEVMASVGVDSVGIDKEFGLGSDRRLCCLSRNLALKLVAISFSSSSSQIIESTSQLSFTSVSSWEEEEDKKEEGDGEGDEDDEAGGKILVF